MGAHLRLTVTTTTTQRDADVCATYLRHLTMGTLCIGTTRHESPFSLLWTAAPSQVVESDAVSFRESMTVIVPTFNRCALLRDVLQDLDRQGNMPERFEVIVVDDGSTDGTPEVLRSFHPKHYDLRSVRQRNQGLSVARNAGAEAATGTVLAYLDDDVFVDPKYVSGLVSVFASHPDVAAVAGQVTLKLEAPRPRWLTPGLEEFLSKFDARSRPELVLPPDSPRGANFAVRRSVWADLGGFSLGFDRQGDSLVSNGELEFFRR